MINSDNMLWLNYYFDAFRNYLNFFGRATRKEYWIFTLFYYIFYFAIFIVLGQVLSGMMVSAISIIYILVSFLPVLAISIRRLHDIGKSGWWLLLILLPIIGWIILFIFSVMPSEPGVNRHGPNKYGF